MFRVKLTTPISEEILKLHETFSDRKLPLQTIRRKFYVVSDFLIFVLDKVFLRETIKSGEDDEIKVVESLSGNKVVYSDPLTIFVCEKLQLAKLQN